MDKAQAEARESRQLILQMTEHPGWALLFARGFRPQIREWRRLLLTDPFMDDTQRRGLVQALTSLKEGFFSAYENSGVRAPQWLKKEFEDFLDGGD